MDKKITVDTIMEFLKKNIEEKTSLSPNVFCDAADKLNVLQGDETDKLAELQQQVAQEKVNFIDQGMSVAEAKTRVEAMDIFKETNKQNAKVKQIEEFIKINKIRSRLKDSEYRL